MKRNRIPDKVEVRVKCCGQTHRVTFQDGPAILHDHTAADICLLRAAQGLAGERTGCLKVMHDYVYGNMTQRPAHRRLRDALFQKHGKPGREPRKIPLRERLHLWVKGLVMAAVERCSYRESRSHWAGGEHTISVEFAPDGAGCQGSSHRVWSTNGKWSGNNSEWRIRVSKDWVQNVHMAGMAVVDSHFVLAVLPPVKNEFRVLAVRQGKGFEIHPHPACVKFDADRRPVKLLWRT